MRSDFFTEFEKILRVSPYLYDCYTDLSKDEQKKVETAFNDLVWQMMDAHLQETDVLLQRYRAQYRKFIRLVSACRIGKRVQAVSPDWVLLDRRTFNDMGGNTHEV